MPTWLSGDSSGFVSRISDDTGGSSPSVGSMSKIKELPRVVIKFKDLNVTMPEIDFNKLFPNGTIFVRYESTGWYGTTHDHRAAIIFSEFIEYWYDHYVEFSQEDIERCKTLGFKTIKEHYSGTYHGLCIGNQFIYDKD